ncbi:MAG: tRNA uridine-5-carboxymethylaminomethyl(34) synthesis enzyme MnmG [Bradymonadales bacterium]|nr:MAG: tRNA uridine-5-carboxymethylaminomethyl(34) synthesis enzyme MnmG [Bradymonadales bacterium]
MKLLKDSYDVIVVGAGHAGVEAALAAQRKALKVLLLSMSADQIATMSCNPAVGGLGKSQLAKELDILGGQMARIADQSALQYRVLNARKGPAVRATRVHCDRHEYRQRMKFFVESQEGLYLKQAQVTELLFEGHQLIGLKTKGGQPYYSRQIVITTGTFMNGKAHLGHTSFSAGRAGEAASVGLSDFLSSIGLRIRRFKTGTVPRVDARSIDFTKTEEQASDPEASSLSFFTKERRKDLEPAHLTYTNPRTHEIIRQSMDQSPLYSGMIESRGPRYCPSVEDKVLRFPDKDRHQVFLEREGRWTHEVYVGGLSTSLPLDRQEEFLRSIEGLESVEIIRPGYAIEYDYLDSTQLKHNLEVRDVPGLFFAGQVNGTSGYEEAAAQGLMAGINAALRAKGEEAFTLKRAEAYTGVLIDDLVERGTEEPYRMLSSRAEWRLLLREDNVDQRLFPHAKRLGLLSEADLESLESRLSLRQESMARLSKINLKASEHLSLFRSLGLEPPSRPMRFVDYMRRPEFKTEHLGPILEALEEGFELSDMDWTQILTDLKYSGYVKQAETQIHQMDRMERMKIPEALNFGEIKGLPIEAIESLSKNRPRSFFEAKRLQGLTPASLQVLALYIQRERKNHACQKA